MVPKHYRFVICYYDKQLPKNNYSVFSYNVSNYWRLTAVTDQSKNCVDNVKNHGRHEFFKLH
jgi:hypothetical protein